MIKKTYDQIILPPPLPFQWKEGEGQRPWEGDRVVKEQWLPSLTPKYFCSPITVLVIGLELEQWFSNCVVSGSH